MKERRRFYRIDDSVILNYRAFPENEVDGAVSRLKMLGSQHKLLQNSLGSLELRLDFLLDEITDPLPEIAEALGIINRKLSILSQFESASTSSALGINDAPKPAEKHEINLSGSGIAFSSPTGFSAGETMEIEFVLFPDYYNIKAIGKVVSCHEVRDPDAETKFDVAVDFVYLEEADQEFIVAHILKKQSEELKAQRESSKQEESELDTVE